MASNTAARPGVVFGRIDRSAVRVFAVQNVTQETVRGRYRSRVIGIPQAGHGTGVIVDPRGVVVTAKHVVDGARHVAVRLPGDGPVLPARVVHSDPELDFAILLVISDQPLPAIELPDGPVSLNVRETVDSVGYPHDPDRKQPQSSRGIVSGLYDDGRLQVDMSLNPGNSGGPLLDSQERLVGIVVAGSDPTRGSQGIGIAVPIGPIRMAYDQIRRNGELSRVYRELQGSRETAAQTAEAVDAIVRLGGLDLLQEAADFTDNPEASRRIDSLRTMADRVRDPDVLALLAAYFWDAAQVMVERSGGAPTPAQMPPGPARQLADDLWRRALSLAARARQLDPAIVQRSPFVGYLAGTGAPVVATRSAWGDQPGGPPGPAALPGQGAGEQQSWAPWILAGPAFSGSDGDAGFGFGVRLGLLFPLGSGGPRRGAKFRALAGLGADVGTWGNDLSFFIATEFGFGLRVGGRVALHLYALWSPGYAAVPGNCEDYGFGYSGDETYCTTIKSYTPLAGHFGIGVRFGSFHVGASWRLYDSDLLHSDVVPDDNGFVWSMSIPELSWTF